MPAVATMTYVYADSTAVVGPLALDREPGSYNLCAVHADRVSVPLGWEVIRLPMDRLADPEEASDDLLALADAVRAIGLRHDEPEPEAVEVPAAAVEPAALRQMGHLRLISSNDQSEMP